ncbi:LuxR C-terminal-related transcriptional regulator [Saccharothrix coeruleofusca]|uniref:DNA-binding response regulator n=1 Tax=Saccharothrix coeruleofusca TaxID=33919 RepID=A0A918EGU2_9PSEU|nr:response regulator transcription factor [Saccharothrix coeruleofusca]MBP2334782.1 DNA-binding NarL/FixJ family response regulator [Saccharothrix coeruleofusca]GGP74215.1 DNA-binding response regulator [Saccharothrix coeruleofusca]
MGLLQRFGHTVVASVGDPDALLEAVPPGSADIVVTDVRMPPTFTDEGMQAALKLRRAQPGLPVLVLSQYVEQTYAAELLDSDRGAGIGYLLKDRVGDVAQFADAVSRVAEGGTVIDPEVVRQLVSQTKQPLDRLTPRELEVLGLMAEGRANGAIAAAMFVSEAAVAKHIASILTKLDLPQGKDTHRRVLAVLAYLRDPRTR